MNFTFAPFVLALLGGVLMASQAVINANLGRLVGSIATVGAVSAAITCSAMLAISFGNGNAPRAFRALAQAPIWMPIAGGLLGAGIMGCVYWATPRIGAGSTIVLLIAGQLCFAAVADHFGLLGLQVQKVDAVRLAGLLAVAGGAWLVSIR